MGVKINSIHFKILGVNKFSTKEEIKKAYRQKIKIWHPDKFTNDSEKQIEAIEKSKAINEAFVLLRNYIAPLINTNNENLQPESQYKQTKYNNETHRTNSRYLNIKRINVNSYNILSIGYDSTKLVLQVAFRNGSIYQYYKVPPDVYSLLTMNTTNDTFIKSRISSRYRSDFIK